MSPGKYLAGKDLPVRTGLGAIRAADTPAAVFPSFAQAFRQAFAPPLRKSWIRDFALDYSSAASGGIGVLPARSSDLRIPVELPEAHADETLEKRLPGRSVQAEDPAVGAIRQAEVRMNMALSDRREGRGIEEVRGKGEQGQGRSVSAENHAARDVE
jgi:hypothetical protein